MTRSILAELTTTMNLLSGICILIGLRYIRKGNREAHKRSMLTAVGFSAVFLILYVTRIVFEGTTRFPGTGWLRTVYLLILGTHSILAAGVLPLVIVTVWRGLRNEHRRHRRLGRITYPIWLYVSFTGPVIYFMLYRLPERWLMP